MCGPLEEEREGGERHTCVRAHTYTHTERQGQREVLKQPSATLYFLFFFLIVLLSHVHLIFYNYCCKYQMSAGWEVDSKGGVILKFFKVFVHLGIKMLRKTIYSM